MPTTPAQTNAEIADQTTNAPKGDQRSTATPT